MRRVFTPVTCLGCGCACDDISLVIDSNGIVSAERACELGVAWFHGSSAQAPAPRVASGTASVEDVLAATTALLKEADYPLVYLAPELSCEAQREAIALADAIGAALDSVSSSAPLAGILAAQEQGHVSATLGEIRNRADVVVFWGVDPSAAYPRFWSRYAPGPEGRHVPGGRRSRTVVAVDIGHRCGPADADVRVAVDADDEIALLTHAAAGLEPTEAGPSVPDAASGRRDSETPAASGLAAGPHSQARQLAATMRSGRYVAIVVDGEGEHDASDSLRSSALARLVRRLNDVTRAALCTLRAGGNRSGADAVMTWQTGYPVAVDFARGYPEYDPWGGSASARLRRGTDAVLIVGAPERIPGDVRALMFERPCVVIGPMRVGEMVERARATIATAVPGIHEQGLAYRMDDIPVRLQAVLEGPPQVAPLLRELRRRCLAS